MRGVTSLASAEAASTPLSIPLRRPSLRARVAVLAIIGGLILWAGFQACERARDYSLDCTRDDAASGAVFCTLRTGYPLGVTSSDPLGQARETMVLGDSPNTSLLLRMFRVSAVYLPVEGMERAAIDEVAQGIRDMIASTGPASATWALARPAPALEVAALLMLVPLLLVLAGFFLRRRGDLEFDPRSRLLTIRQTRWPLGDKKLTRPIDDVFALQTHPVVVSSGAPRFVVALLFRDGTMTRLHGDSDREGLVDEFRKSIDARIAQWIKM